jgi:hypothetical protein
MPSNTRIRVEADIEDYLRSQSERVIGKPANEVSGAELTTIANRILYEHKLAQTMIRQEFIPRVLTWIKAILPGGGGNKVVAISPSEQPGLKATEKDEDFDFATDFAAQFDEDAA